ncbi:bile acid:sodium symporter family protein [Caldisericum exile]|uniref:Bile acid:sodium symporter family protein n=1 Tax=Caldisericum exile (strain DSM 21853 / NBRC 104410 / AZM16c01) TaxID=511051 RepID=A0A7U6GDK1_CALEA|nr:bile acid:sodium symporter [Caldisericum exile]BAL80443.1 bile acid:sodium symporter family protein [Caldisericum exile AZM16c01]
MKKIAEFIENNTSFIITLGIPLGLIFPQFSILKPYLTDFLMLVLFFTFLKLEFQDLLKISKKVKLLVFAVILDLIILPIIVFLISKILKVEDFLLVSLLLFSAVPAGVASASITDILEGDTILSTTIIIITHVIAPITIPILFYLLLRKVIHVDYINISITLIKLIFIPLILSQIFKYTFKKLTPKIISKNKIITTVILLLLGTTIAAVNYNFIMRNPIEALKFILMSIPIYFLFMIVPFYLSPFLPMKERISMFATKTFINVTIGVVLALSFLDAKASLVLTLAQIPWSLMIFPSQIFININKKAPQKKRG